MLTAAASRLAVRRTFSVVPRRTIITVKDAIYVSNATAIGQGRNGTVESDGDAPLSLKLASPKSIGGKGDGQNPEQLFAMGYASCFLGALQFLAAKVGKKDAVAKAKIHSAVTLGTAVGMDGYALKVNLKVEGVEDEALIKAAHESCPYSRALRHGVEVNVGKA